MPYLMLKVKRLDIRFSLLVNKAQPHFFIRENLWKEKTRKLKLGHQEIGIYKIRSHVADWNGKTEYGKPIRRSYA